MAECKALTGLAVKGLIRDNDLIRDVLAVRVRTWNRVV